MCQCTESPWKQIEALKAELKQLKSEKIDLIKQTEVLLQFYTFNLNWLSLMQVKRVMGCCAQMSQREVKRLQQRETLLLTELTDAHVEINRLKRLTLDCVRDTNVW